MMLVILAVWYIIVQEVINVHRNLTLYDRELYHDPTFDCNKKTYQIDQMKEMNVVVLYC
jgi:hypothetical protein